ncbi:MAG: thymidine kinase [Bacteroidota bacterium]
MFVEPQIVNRNIGWIEVICGCMFSGKTEELIRRVNRALIANQSVEIFKPQIENRYHKTKVISHNKSQVHSTPVGFANDILLRVEKCDVVGIDEAQFFDDDIVEVVKKLTYHGKRVIVAGLDMDFKGRPFHPMDQLMAISEFITKVHAICMECGSLASFSHRRTKSTKTVVLGENDIYEALCRSCFYAKNHPK